MQQRARLLVHRSPYDSDVGSGAQNDGLEAHGTVAHIVDGIGRLGVWKWYRGMIVVGFDMLPLTKMRMSQSTTIKGRYEFA